MCVSMCYTCHSTSYVDKLKTESGTVGNIETVQWGGEVRDEDTSILFSYNIGFRNTPNFYYVQLRG